MVNIDNLFKLIAENGINQSRLAENTSISTGNISDWKKGKSMPSAAKLDELATYFNVSVDYLLGRTDSPECCKSIINSNNSNGDNSVQNINNGESLSNRDIELIKKINSLNFDDYCEIIKFINSKTT